MIEASHVTSHRSLFLAHCLGSHKKPYLLSLLRGIPGNELSSGEGERKASELFISVHRPLKVKWRLSQGNELLPCQFVTEVVSQGTEFWYNGGSRVIKML